MIYLLVYITDNCSACSKVVTKVEMIKDRFNNINLEIKNITKVQADVSIVPAVFINKTLFCYGEFDSNKLINVLAKLKK